MTTQNSHTTEDRSLETDELTEGDTLSVTYESVYGDYGNRQEVALTVTDAAWSTGVYAEDEDGVRWKVEVDGGVAIDVQKANKHGNLSTLGVAKDVRVESADDEAEDEDEDEGVSADHLDKYAGRVAKVKGETVTDLDQIEVGDRVARKAGKGRQGIVEEVTESGTVRVRQPTGGFASYYHADEEWEDGEKARFTLPGDSDRYFQLVRLDTEDEEEDDAEEESEAEDDDGLPEVEEGDRVRVEYTGAFRGRDHTIEGEVVVDPFLHRDTPEDAIDFEVNGDEGSYTARVRDGRVYGLHHATRRHDNRKGSVESVEVVGEVMTDGGRDEDDDDDDEGELSATERARRFMDERTSEEWTVEDVQDHAVSNTTNASDDRIIRFNGDREGGVSIEVAEGSIYKGPYAPDKILAEQVGMDGIRAALDRLEEVANLRNVGEHRLGTFKVDDDGERVTGMFFTRGEWLPDAVDEDALEQELVDLANEEPEEEGGITVRGFEQVVATDAILGDHAHKSRRAGFMDLAEKFRAVQEQAIEAQKRYHESEVGRSDVTLDLGADAADALREACEYAVEGAGLHSLTEEQVEVAERLYQRLGGTLPEDRGPSIADADEVPAEVMDEVAREFGMGAGAVKGALSFDAPASPSEVETTADEAALEARRRAAERGE